MASNPNPPTTPPTPIGGPSSRGPNTKLYIRMQNVARYRIQGRYSDARIAEMVGLTPSGLANLIRHPDYIEIENALLDGRLSSIDRSIAEDNEAKKQYMRHAVAPALQFLIEGVLQRRDLRTALACAKTIIENDPDKTFADAQTNVTRTQEEVNHADNAPTLPGDIVASLAVQGNTVIAEIKSGNVTKTTTTTKVDVTKLPEALGDA